MTSRPGKNIFAFQDIPYASPPVRERRFKVLTDDLTTDASYDELITKRSGSTSSTTEQTTITNYADQFLALATSFCDKRVEVLKEKLKRVTLQMSKNNEFYENRTKALIEREGLRSQMCESRVRQAGQRSIETSTQFNVAPITSTTLPTLDYGSKYYKSTDKLRWEEARQYCEGKGMKLASIETEAENKALYELIGETWRTFWVSGTDLDSEGTFYWNGTGSKVEGFTNFDKGEPSNFNGTEHCLELVAHDGAIYWNDNNCNIPFQFICEKSL
ncbi:lectin subunit alpha-like [Cloeon dipterum]|uniref:lectin subunit alpha-like n=1 Tax=Cloeon dipterum TaxID=197152 RepID=UPI0032203BD1